MWETCFEILTYNACRDMEDDQAKVEQATGTYIPSVFDVRRALEDGDLEMNSCHATVQDRDDGRQTAHGPSVVC
jgi:hypothetical protein